MCWRPRAAHCRTRSSGPQACRRPPVALVCSTSACELTSYSSTPSRYHRRYCTQGVGVAGRYRSSVWQRPPLPAPTHTRHPASRAPAAPRPQPAARARRQAACAPAPAASPRRTCGTLCSSWAPGRSARSRCPGTRCRAAAARPTRGCASWRTATPRLQPGGTAPARAAAAGQLAVRRRRGGEEGGEGSA